MHVFLVVDVPFHIQTFSWGRGEGGGMEIMQSGVRKKQGTGEKELRPHRYPAKYRPLNSLQFHWQFTYFS